jgi:hypothetical protein
MCILHSKQLIIVQTPYFFYPDTDNELESVTQRLKANSSTGLDKNPYIIS